MSIQTQTPRSAFVKSHAPIHLSAVGTGFGIAGLVLVLFALMLSVPFLFNLNAEACSGVCVSTVHNGLIICGVLVVCGVALLVIASRRVSFKNEDIDKHWLARNELDYATSQHIRTQLPVAGPPPSIAEPAAFEVRLAENLVLGEIDRHFDRRMEGSITGWLDHRLGVYGWGAGVRLGNVGLGLGQTGIAGQSQVNLSLEGTIRDDLLNNSFIAVLERTLPTGMVDTLRVIVPPDSAIRAFLHRFVGALGQQVTSGSHCHDAFLPLASLPISVSHVSDLLKSLERRPVESRPTVTVVGAMLAEGIMLGEAVQFANDSRWYNLFPISSCMKAMQLARDAQTALAEEPLPLLRIAAVQR